VIRALGVELLRLRKRRAAMLLALLALVGCLVVLGFSIGDAAPPSAGDRAAAQAQVDAQLADPAFQEQLKECQDAVAAGGSDMWPADMNCAESLTPRVEWFLGWSPPQFVQDYSRGLLAVTMILALAMALVGVTFAGADFSAGTMGTQLLFQPRRIVAYASKGGALVLVAVAVGAIGAALAGVASYGTAASWGSTAMEQRTATGTVTVTWAELIGDGLRGVAGVGAAALVGYALAMLFRSSLVAVSIIAGYGLVGEGVVRALFRGVEPYLVSSRVIAWLQGPYEIRIYPNACGPGPCEPQITTVSIAAGGEYLLILLAVLLVVAGWVFSRRDVN
jgi:hypothetical protein